MTTYFGYLGSEEITIVEQPFRSRRERVLQARRFGKFAAGSFEREFVLSEAQKNQRPDSTWLASHYRAMPREIFQRLTISLAFGQGCIRLWKGEVGESLRDHKHGRRSLALQLLDNVRNMGGFRFNDDETLAFQPQRRVTSYPSYPRKLDITRRGFRVEESNFTKMGSGERVEGLGGFSFIGRVNSDNRTYWVRFRWSPSLYHQARPRAKRVTKPITNRSAKTDPATSGATD